MEKIKTALMVALLVAGLCCGPTAVIAAEEAIADTRILIDISGSMKKNDPKNLRRPAVRLLVGLLPAKSRAGVWTFGKWVNMQVPLGIVDKQWRDRARDGASKIGSPGQYTNIEEAIRRSTRDWEGIDDRYRRHMVLLTDGMVDVSKKPAESAASRKRILEELLPKLKEMQVKVHTIALSARADHELMQALSGETEGWYEQVDNAEQLQRIFLRIFEKVGRPDTLPLKDNKFQVDASIEEVTLLVFRKAEAAPTKVVMPSGKTFDADTAPSGVSWHRDQGYDLLTIAKPEVGEWKVQAAMDPDNRVVVVTNLKMIASEIPGRMIAGESTPLTVHFTNGGKQITRKEFLDVVSVKGEHNDSEGPGEPRPIYDDGQDIDAEANDGTFSLRLGNGLAEGKVELILTAEGTTFQREQRQLFEVVSPLFIESIPEEQSGVQGVKISVLVDTSVMAVESVSLQGSLVSLDGEEQAVMFLPAADGASFETWVDPAQLKQGSWSLGVNASGKTSIGNDISLDLDPVTIEGAKAEVVEEPEPEPETPVTVEEETVEEEEPYGLKEYSIIFGIGNLVIAIIAGLIFWLMRRRAGKADIELVDADEEGDIEAAVEAARGSKSDSEQAATDQSEVVEAHGTEFNVDEELASEQELTELGEMEEAEK